jgi:acetolactate synthase-1/2/3 large subunit
MIQQTQDQWLSSNYYASSYEGGLSFPNYEDLAKSFNLDYITIRNEDILSEDILRLNSSNNAVICNIIIAKSARVIPQVKFGCPNEDMEPLLPRNVFKKCMIISEDKTTTKSNE